MSIVAWFSISAGGTRRDGVALITCMQPQGKVQMPNATYPDPTLFANARIDGFYHGMEMSSRQIDV